MNKTLYAGAVLMAFLVFAAATDINKGKTFTPGESGIDHTDLNNIVDLATINTDFYTTKDAVTPTGSDVFLLVRSGVFYRCTLSTLLTANTALITGQSEDTAPAYNDYFLSYDTSGGTLRKVTLTNMVWTQINGLAFATPLASDGFLSTRGGTNNYVAFSNMFSTIYSGGTFTNLPQQTAPGGADGLLIYNATTGTNGILTLSNLMTGATLGSTLTNGDTFLYWDSTNNVLRKATAAMLRTYMTNTLPNIAYTNQLAVKFTSTAYPVPGTGTGTNVAHSLGGLPQVVRWVFVCTNSVDNFALGDELPIESIQSDDFAQAFTCGGNATNVFIVRSASNTSLRLYNKTTGANDLALTSTDWNIKAYAIKFP